MDDSERAVGADGEETDATAASVNPNEAQVATDATAPAPLHHLAHNCYPFTNETGPNPEHRRRIQNIIDFFGNTPTTQADDDGVSHMNSNNSNPNEAVYSAQAGPYNMREIREIYWQDPQSWQWLPAMIMWNTLANSHVSCRKDDDDDDLDDLPELVDL